MEENLLTIISQTLKNPNYLGDDCAVINLEDTDYLFSQDNFVENTHFSQDYFSPRDIGWKALAVNISDICAMAGLPLYVMVGLSLNKDQKDKEAWVKEFYKGMQACADFHGGLEIIGGDISSQNNFTSISISIIGKTSHVLMRKVNEQKDYLVCVTGKFGNSGNFLKTKNKLDSESHLRPKARIKEAQFLREKQIPGALMDASDGLAAALYTLAETNKAVIELESDLIPRDKHLSLDEVFYGGEDYELVGLFEKVPENFTKIGVLTHKDKQIKVYDVSQDKCLEKSLQYQHF